MSDVQAAAERVRTLPRIPPAPDIVGKDLLLDVSQWPTSSVRTGRGKTQSIRFPVRVLGTRWVYGRWEAHVSPVDGQGARWVMADRLFLRDGRQAVPQNVEDWPWPALPSVEGRPTR